MTSWRNSRLNVVAALRDLPTNKNSTFSWLWILVSLGLFSGSIFFGILLFILMGITEAIYPLTSNGLSLKGIGYMTVSTWLWINAILGLFNMLPFGPLDGLKVKGWSENYFWLTIVLFGILVYSQFTGYSMGIILSLSNTIIA